MPVLALQRTVYMPGGAANVARNVVALGARAELVGVVGADEAAAELRRDLSALPGLTAQLVIDPARPTTTKTRFVAERRRISAHGRGTRHGAAGGERSRHCWRITAPPSSTPTS